MKIEILEYKIWKGPKVRVQSHNHRKGIWKENPWWSFHNKVANGQTKVYFGPDERFTKRYSKEVKN